MLLHNQLGLNLMKVRAKPKTATGINYLKRNRCYRSVCFSKDNNEINKWKKNGSEKMKWWRGGVLWNCAVKRFSFLISWSADDGACALTAESDKEGNKKDFSFFPPNTQAFLCHIYKYNNKTISLRQMTIDRYHDLVCTVIFFNVVIC